METGMVATPLDLLTIDLLTIDLLTIPPGVAEAAGLLQAVDGAWLEGFANLGAAQSQSLERLGAAFGGTPLADRLSSALAAFDRHEFALDSFLTLAIARSALQGAMHDALQGQILAVLGRSPSPDPSQSPPSSEQHPQTLPQSAAVQQWLMELALAGLSRLEPEQWLAITPTLAALQQDPQAWGLASLLTGWLQDLNTTLPCVDFRQIPLHRWVDLWSRAYLGTLPALTATPTAISGTFTPLGVDLRAHGHCLSLRLPGLLWTGDTTGDVTGDIPQFAYLNYSTYTVETIAAVENWLLLEVLRLPMAAIAQGHSLQLTGQLWPNGALQVQNDGELGAAIDRPSLLQTYFGPWAKEAFQGVSVNPSDRHPVQVGELVWFQDYTLQSSAQGLTLTPKPPQANVAEPEGGDRSVNLSNLRLAVDRIHPLSGFTAKDLEKAKGILGLLQWDAGQWSLKPLGIFTGKKWLDPSSSAMATWANPPKKASVATLQERASRLLRS